MLPTLADVAAARRGKPMPKDPIGRAKAHTTFDREDARKLALWRQRIQQRDGLKCRYSGKPVKKTLKLVLDRAEAHHLAPRGNFETRYDVRNGLILSYHVHEQVERHDLRIEGTKFFMVNGQRYINASAKVRFVNAVTGEVRVG